MTKKSLTVLTFAACMSFINSSHATNQCTQYQNQNDCIAHKPQCGWLQFYNCSCGGDLMTCQDRGCSYTLAPGACVQNSKK